MVWGKFLVNSLFILLNLYTRVHYSMFMACCYRTRCAGTFTISQSNGSKSYWPIRFVECRLCVLHDKYTHYIMPLFLTWDTSKDNNKLWIFNIIRVYLAAVSWLLSLDISALSIKLYLGSIILTAFTLKNCYNFIKKLFALKHIQELKKFSGRILKDFEQDQPWTLNDFQTSDTNSGNFKNIWTEKTGLFESDSCPSLTCVGGFLLEGHWSSSCWHLSQHCKKQHMTSGLQTLYNVLSQHD